MSIITNTLDYKMLIQITNRCHEGCAHCLQDSNPNGGHMTAETFKKALEFSDFLGIEGFCISGGEPTEHPDLEQLLLTFEEEYSNKNIIQKYYEIASNGTWITDKDKCNMMRKITNFKHYIGCQIYSNKVWYKDYELVKSHQKDYRMYPKMMFNEEKIFMQDLGRAHNNKFAQEEVKKNPYHMQCFNASLICHQIPNPALIGQYMNVSHKMMCKPLVAWDGSVHLSECCLCPSVGNINTDSFEKIWSNMQKFVPCMKCHGAKKAVASDNPRIQQAVKLLGLK